MMSLWFIWLMQATTETKADLLAAIEDYYFKGLMPMSTAVCIR